MLNPTQDWPQKACSQSTKAFLFTFCSLPPLCPNAGRYLGIKCSWSDYWCHSHSLSSSIASGRSGIPVPKVREFTSFYYGTEGKLKTHKLEQWCYHTLQEINNSLIHEKNQNRFLGLKGPRRPHLLSSGIGAFYHISTTELPRPFQVLQK